MKGKKISYVAVFILVVSLLLVTIAPAAAPKAQPRYVKIDTLTAELYEISLAGRATCMGLVSVWDTSCTATLTVELQQSSDGASWTTIKSWTKSGSDTVAIEEYWYVDSGYQYRVLAGATVFSLSGNIIELEIAESAVQTYSTP